MMLSNIDDVRARIMALESAAVYDDRAWQRVLADLAAEERPSALADAQRRMETAKINQIVPVAVETTKPELKAYWVYEKGSDWGMFLHAISVNLAKTTYLHQYPGLNDPEYCDLRVRRCNGSELLDIVPFTDFSLRLAGYLISDDDDHVRNGFLDDCPCAMCKKEKMKSSSWLSVFMPDVAVMA